MAPPGRVEGSTGTATARPEDAVVLTATPAFDPVTQTYAVAVLDGRSDLADDALLDQYIADEKAAGNDVMAALEARLPSLAPADRKAALKKLLTFSAEGPDGRALKKPSTDELKTLIASLENPEATPTPAPAESKQSVELPLPKSLDAKKVEKDATLAKAALTADPQTFQKAMQRYQTREQREAVLYVVFKDAAPEELAHAKEIMAKVWDPGLKRQLDIAIRVREAQLPGGALYGVESPDAIAAYRNFVGPTCDTWLKQLGISEDDVKAWLTAPPGTPPPASIQKALDDVQNGRPSYANVNFVLYGMPAFIALQKARGVSAEDLKPQDALINKARNQGLIVQKQEAGALEGEAAYHDRLAADLDKKAEEIEAGANPGDAVKLREQANTQRAMAKTQRGAAIVTTTNIANMYEKQINTPGAKPSQATLDAHTEMTDATGRMILVDAKDETGHLIVLAGQHKGDKAYTDETPPKLTNDEPRGKPGDPDYFPGGVGYWVDKGEEYNSKAGESGGHVSLKTDYQGYKRYVDNKFLELRDYPPKSPPATYDPRAEELRIESVQLLADEKKTVEDRVAYLMAKSPRTAKEDDDLLAMNGRLQTLTSELNAEKKRLKKAIDDGKIAHKQLDAATKAVSGLTDKLDGAVVTEDGRTSRRGGLRQELKDLEERQKGAETDTAKAAFTTAIANKKLEIKQAEIDQNLATQKLELLQRQQKAAGQPALGDMIARTEGSVIKALNAEYGITDDGKGAPEIGPSTDVIYAAATKSTEYVETNLMPPKEGLIGVEDKDKVKFGTVSLENGAFYADKSAAERGSGNQPTPQSLADAKKATECVSYSVDALDYIWAGSELHQQFAPVVAEGSRTVAIDLAKVDPKNASLCLRYADTATGLIDLDAITPTKADGTKKSPEEIAEEKAAKKALKDKLTIDNALNGAMAVVMGAFCSPADPNQRPPDMTMASIRRARELINKIQPPTTEATKALEALDRLESFATGAITLNNNRADLAKRSAGNANASITIAQEEKDAALEKTQSIFVDLPIISTLTLGVGVLVDDEIDQAQLESGGAWTMAQLRDAIKKKQLTDKLSPVEQQLSDNLDALAMMSDVLEKATAEGRQFEVYKYIATGDTEALQGVADELGATDGDGQAFQATKVTELITDDQSAFKSYFLHGDNYFKDAEAQGFDMVDASDEAEEVAHTQGTVTGTQSSAVQRANIESTDYQKDMIWVQIAVAAGEMVLSCFIPGAALRTMASIGRYAKLAIGVARVASFVARARTIAATYRVVRIAMSALRFAAAAGARWQTFAKSGRAAGLLAKVVEAYAVFGIQKGVTKLAEAAGIPKNTFGGKLFYFAVGAIGTSAQNKIAKWTQAGKEVILPTAQFMATTFGIPLLPKEKQEFWNEVAEYGFPAIGALVGSYNEHGAIKRQHAEGAMQQFNGALAEKGHPPLSEKQQGQGADLLYKVATAKDSVSYENARAELQVWGEKNKLPPEAMKGLDQQAAVAYAGTKHLGADVNWAKESPTPEALTKKYDDVVAELMAAHPEMPIEQARMFAQQLIAGKINAAMPVVAEGQEPNQKDAAKIKELGGALDAVNLKMAHDTAATATERNVKERGVELDDAQKGFVREELVPEMMKTLGSETLTPEQGVEARAKMKERLVNEQKMTPEQADAVIRSLAEECAAQVGRSSTAVACEGQLPETVLRIAEENNLRRLGYSPEEAHAIAVGHYAPDAAMSAMCDANTQIASAGGTLITKEQAKAIEGDIASAIEGYDRDARAGGKSLGDVGKDLEAKLTPIIGAENARAVAKATVANLVADAALGAANGSGPGLASLPGVDGPEQRKAQVDAIEKLMTEAAKGTEPPLFSAAEIADAKGTAIEKMALEDGAKRTAEDGKANDPKALMDNVEASAAELQKTFPDIDPKQVRADAAVKQASEFILQNAGENTAKMTPEQAEKEIAKVAVEQFGCDPAQVKKAIQKRNAEIKAAETKGQERAKMADDAKAKPPVVRSGPAAPPPPDDTNTEAAPDSDAAITQDAPTVEAPTVKTAPGDDGTVNGAMESLLTKAPHRRLLAITESGRTFAVERDADGKIFLRPWDNKGDVGPLGENIVELRLLPAPDEPMKSVDVTGQKQPEGLEIARWEPMSQKEKSERAEIEQEFGKKFADDFYPQLKRARQRFDASNEVDLGPFSLRQDVKLLETIAAMPPDLAREALDTYAASTDEGRARLNTIVTHAKDPRVGMAAIRYAYEKAAANGQRAVPLEILDAIVQATAPKTGEPQLTDPAAVKGVVDALFEQHSAREAAPDSAPSSSDLPPTKPGKKGAPKADEATKPQGKKPAPADEATKPQGKKATPTVEQTEVSPRGPAATSKPVDIEVIDTTQRGANDAATIPDGPRTKEPEDAALLAKVDLEQRIRLTYDKDQDPPDHILEQMEAQKAALLKRFKEEGCTPQERALLKFLAESGKTIDIEWRWKETNPTSNVAGEGDPLIRFAAIESVSRDGIRRVPYELDVFEVFKHEASHVLDWQNDVPGYRFKDENNQTITHRMLYSEMRANLWATSGDYARALRVTASTYDLDAFIRKYDLSGYPPEVIYKALEAVSLKFDRNLGSADEPSARREVDAVKEGHERVPGNDPRYAFNAFPIAPTGAVVSTSVRYRNSETGETLNGTLHQLEGTVGKEHGVFEWIVLADGRVMDKVFVPDGEANGQVHRDYYTDDKRMDGQAVWHHGPSDEQARIDVAANQARAGMPQATDLAPQHAPALQKLGADATMANRLGALEARLVGTPPLDLAAYVETYRDRLTRYAADPNDPAIAGLVAAEAKRVTAKYSAVHDAVARAMTSQDARMSGVRLSDDFAAVLRQTLAAARARGVPDDQLFEVALSCIRIASGEAKPGRGATHLTSEEIARMRAHDIEGREDADAGTPPPIDAAKQPAETPPVVAQQPTPKPPDTPAPLMSATPPVMSDEPKMAPTTTQNTADASVKEAPRPPKLDLEGVPPQNKNELELLRQYAGSSDAHLYRMITDGVRDNAGKLPSPAKERVLAAVDAIDGYRQAVEAHGVRRMITGDELAEAQKMPSFAEAHWRPWVDGAVDRMKLPPGEAAALKQNLYDAGEGLRRMQPGERKLALEWLNEATGQMRVEMLELLGSRSRIAGEVEKGTLSQEDAARISEPYNPFKRIWRSPFEALKRWWWGSKIASGDLQTLAKAPKELWKDEAFALSALARFGKYNLKDVFPYIPASLRGDAAFMLEVVRAVGAPAMEFASASLAKNPQFIKEAIKLDPNVIHHGIAAELMKTDREVALAVVSAAGARDAYGTLPDKLRNDPEIALAAVRAGDATTYAKVPPGLRDDPKIIGAAIDRDGSVLLDRPELATDRAWAMRAARAELAPARIPAAFMDDPEVVAAYVRRDPLSLASASPRLGSDRALISLAIDTLAAMPSADRRQVIAGTDERKATAFGRIFAEDLAKHPDLALAYLRAVPEAVLSTTFAKDQRLAEMALMTDRSMFNWMPEGARTDALIEAMALKDPFFLDLPSIKPELRERILAQHPEIAKARADIVAQAKGVGITQLGRFAGIDVLREVIKNRTTPDVNDPRPLAVVVYPKDDHNGAFESANAREDLKALSVTHRLVFIEARNDADAVAGIKAATKNRPTGLLILGAHGAPTAMEWSKGNDAVAGSKTFKKGELDAALAPGATVILESCSTGSGRFDQLNMANFFSWLMPSATVHAPTKPVATELSLDASGRLKPRYTEGEHNTYVIPGTTASDETKRDAGKLIEAKEVLVDGERFLTRVAPDGRGVELVTPTGDVARTLTPDECKALVETGDVVLGREAVNASFEKERANTHMREQRDECRNIVASMSNGKMMSYYTARIGEAKTPEAMAALRAELEPYKSGGLATTPATLHHVHEGERVSSPQSPYDGKWNGKGAHDWPAIAKIAKEPGYKILEVREDPTTGARFVKIERQGFDKKQNKVVTSTFEKTIYPKSLTPEQVDAAGEAAFQWAKRGAKDTVFTTQPGPPPITKFEATVVAGIPPTEIRIGGFAQGAPPGPFEITTHFPTKATDPMTWPVVPESGY